MEQVETRRVGTAGQSYPTIKGSPHSSRQGTRGRGTSRRRMAASSLTPIYRQASSASTTTRRSSRRARFSTSFTSSASSSRMRHSAGATTAEWLPGQFPTTRPPSASRLICRRRLVSSAGTSSRHPRKVYDSCTIQIVGRLAIKIPADGTANDDHNPPRIAPRHLFDFSMGTDNLLRTDHTRVTLRFTAINLTNKEALYNFLSTFSGTHFVTPRTFAGQIGIVF